MDAVSGKDSAGDAVAAIEAITGIKHDQLSADWREAVASTYRVSAGVHLPPLQAI
jgi:hypothetical protein